MNAVVLHEMMCLLVGFGILLAAAAVVYGYARVLEIFERKMGGWGIILAFSPFWCALAWVFGQAVCKR